jgi:hypothetical protein
MASKRSIKKDLNYMVYDIWDECFILMDINSANKEAAEQLIEDAADFQDEILEKVNAAKGKADYKVIREKMSKAAIDFVNKLNELS